MERSRIDKEGYAARANRRKDAVAQRHEILCTCIAYNLVRLVYLALTTT